MKEKLEKLIKRVKALEKDQKDVTTSNSLVFRDLDHRLHKLEETEYFSEIRDERFDSLMGELDLLIADFKESSDHWLKLPGKNTNMAKGEAYGFCSEQLRHVLSKYKDEK